jgi:hypothetical protein
MSKVSKRKLPFIHQSVKFSLHWWKDLVKSYLSLFDSVDDANGETIGVTNITHVGAGKAGNDISGNVAGKAVNFIENFIGNIIFFEMIRGIEDLEVGFPSAVVGFSAGKRGGSSGWRSGSGS